MFLQTLKFDDLCFNFYEHQYLDESDTTLTVSKNAEGLITGMTMVNNVVNGAPIPFTVPTANAEQVTRPCFGVKLGAGGGGGK